MLTFKGYEIVDRWALNEEELHVLYACEWMVDNKSTIRETAKNWEYSPDLYSRVCHQMRINLERRHWV